MPLNQVRHVAITRLRPYGLWILAAVMVVVGFVTTATMMDGVLRGQMGTRSIKGEPIAVFVCGFLVPFAARRRFTLEVWFQGRKYQWKPPLVVDKASKQLIAETLEAIVETCRDVGVSVADERVE